MLRRFFRTLTRIGAFIGKELSETLRQTRLILSLVLGPFLIMLLFGIGYQATGRDLMTLFVVGDQNLLRPQMIEFAQSMGGNMVFAGTTSDQAAAMQALIDEKVDIIVVVPDDASQKIEAGQQVTVMQYHNEIDPYQVSYVKYIGDAVIQEVNRSVLIATAQQGQEQAPQLRQKLEAARMAADSLQAALVAGDLIKAQQERENMQAQVDALSIAIGAGLAMTKGSDTDNGGADGNSIATILQELNSDSQALDHAGESGQDIQVQIERLEKMKGEISKLEQELAQFEETSPIALVSPFKVETKSVQGLDLSPSDFFTPGVIILLMQHLAVTFAALSFVQERNSGIMELFRVSPLSALEILVGKTVSYLIFGGLVAASISALVVLVLGAPMQGTWLEYALVILAMLGASLGMGFVISLVSATDTQAVQNSMFLLLGSIFFSGFLLHLDFLWRPVRVVAWMLPATYGIKLLQNVMLRGELVDPILISGLTAFGAVLMLLAWLLLGRQMQGSR